MKCCVLNCTNDSEAGYGIIMYDANLDLDQFFCSPCYNFMTEGYKGDVVRNCTLYVNAVEDYKEQQAKINNLVKEDEEVNRDRPQHVMYVVRNTSKYPLKYVSRNVPRRELPA